MEGFPIDYGASLQLSPGPKIAGGQELRCNRGATSCARCVACFRRGFSGMMHGMETDELEQYLNALKRDACYRAQSVLRQTPAEITELVYFVGENGAEQGPFIRKTIARDAGIGEAYERIAQAQRAGRRFKHIPAVLDCHQADEHLVVVTEFVRGETLAAAVRRCGPSEALAVDVMLQLCDAVSELHEQFQPPIIHRDLKPENVIVAQGSLTLIDFGIARTYRENGGCDTTHFGTRPYAPPEQFGFAQTDERSDVYALGKILAFCLAGEGVCDSPLFAAVIGKATALDPVARYASARELKQAIECAVEQAVRQRDPLHGDLCANAAQPAEGQGGVSQAEQARTWFSSGALNEVGAARSLAASAQITSASVPVAGPSVPVAGTGAQVTGPGTQNALVGVQSAAPTRLAALRAWANRVLRPEAIAACVPAWVGVVWNVAVAATVALFVAACVFATVQPNALDSTYPLWFRAFEYGIGGSWFVLVGFLLLDKRRLRKRFRVFAAMPRGRMAAVAFAYFAVTFVLLVIVAQPIVRVG